MYPVLILVPVGEKHDGKAQQNTRKHRVAVIYAHDKSILSSSPFCAAFRLDDDNLFRRERIGFSSVTCPL